MFYSRDHFKNTIDIKEKTRKEVVEITKCAPPCTYYKYIIVDTVQIPRKEDSGTVNFGNS